MRILERSHKLSQRPPQFADIFGGFGQVVGEIDLCFFHPTELVDRQLEAVLILVNQPFDFEEVVLLEDGDEVVDVVPHLRFDLPGAVGQEQRQVRLTIFFGLHLLRSDHKTGGDNFVFLLAAFRDKELFHEPPRHRPPRKCKPEQAIGRSRVPPPD